MHERPDTAYLRVGSHLPCEPHPKTTHTKPTRSLASRLVSTRSAVALGLWTVALFLKSNANNQLKCGSSFFAAVVCLILGIGSSILVTVTGRQCWHVITAGSFFGLFWTELTFITKVVPNSYTSSSQASV